MPKVILNPSAEKDEKLTKAIKHQAVEKNMTIKEMAIASRMNELTFRKRLKEPSKFTISELRNISRGIGLPLAKLLEAEL